MSELADAPQNATLSRSERKKQETRGRLISVSEKLMRARPIDEITIQDITEAADIGHGTFYLHFKSKNEVLTPIIQALAEQWDQVLQENMNFDDPAEVMAFSARHMGRIIYNDPLWRWYLEHSGVPAEDMRKALGSFAARDLGKGLMSGRFNVPEIVVAASFTMGGFVNALLTSFKSDEPMRAIDHMVEMLLRAFGVPVLDAAEIAHRPLNKLRMMNPPK